MRILQTCSVQRRILQFYFNDKAYDVEIEAGVTANFFILNTKSVIKVVRALNTIVEEDDKRIHVKTPEEL